MLTMPICRYWVERKVAAHCDVRRAQSRYDAWLCWNNGAADRAARMANHSRPSEFWALWTKHATESLQVRTWFDETVQLQLAVAEFCTRKGTISPDDVPPRPKRTQRTFTKFFGMDAWDGEVPSSLAQRFSFSLAQQLVTWWKKRVQPGTELMWIPIHYLYLDFQLSTGSCGPLKVQRQWVDAATRKFLAPERFAHNIRVRWFRAFLQFFWRTASITTSVAVCRPDVEIIQAFVPCVAICWDTWYVEEVSKWLARNLKKHCAREAGELRKLPLAKPCKAFTVMPVHR